MKIFFVQSMKILGKYSIIEHCQSNYSIHVWGLASKFTPNLFNLLYVIQKHANHLTDKLELTDSLPPLSHRRKLEDLFLSMVTIPKKLLISSSSYQILVARLVKTQERILSELKPEPKERPTLSSVSMRERRCIEIPYLSIFPPSQSINFFKSRDLQRSPASFTL